MIHRMEPIAALRLAADLKAVSQPLRLRILAHMVAADAPLSPTKVADLLGNGQSKDLGRTSYHVRQLVDARMLKLTRTEPRRGAVEHFYVPTKRGERLIALVTEEQEE